MVNFTAYIGTYTENLLAAVFDVDTLQMRITAQATLPNSSYLYCSPKHKLLYVAQEPGVFGGQQAGGVAACAVTKDSISVLDALCTGENVPCHVAADGAEEYLFLANYNAGTLTQAPLAQNGLFTGKYSVVAHEGTGLLPGRQERPHVHCAIPAPDKTYLAVCDLGIDAVVLYPLDGGELTATNGTIVRLAPGSGPRHLVFSSNGRFAYVVCELNNTVYAFAANGTNWELLQVLPTLPGSFSGRSSCAAIHLTPNGKFLAVSNRGHDSLTVYATQPNGTLQQTCIHSTYGNIPRDFAFTPDGEYILCANQNSNTITLLGFDAQSGTIRGLCATYAMEKPVCVLMV